MAPNALRVSVAGVKIAGGDEYVEHAYGDFLIPVAEAALAGKFQVINRDRLADILREHGLAMSGLVEDFKGVGEVEGIDALVFIHISKPFFVNIQARLVDVHDGKLISSGSATAFNEAFVKGAVERACAGL